MTDGERLLNKLRELVAAFPRQEVTPETITVYAHRLSALPIAAVETAVDRAMDTARFFPTIGEIKDAAAENALGDHALPEGVWAEVKREVRRVGHNRPPLFHKGAFLPPEVPTFADPLVAEAVAATGWAYLCTGEPEGVVKAQFTATLKAIRGRAIERVQTGRRPDGAALGDGALGIGGGDARRP